MFLEFAPLLRQTIYLKPQSKPKNSRLVASFTLLIVVNSEFETLLHRRRHPSRGLVAIPSLEDPTSPDGGGMVVGART